MGWVKLISRSTCLAARMIRFLVHLRTTNEDNLELNTVSEVPHAENLENIQHLNVKYSANSIQISYSFSIGPISKRLIFCVLKRILFIKNLLALILPGIRIIKGDLM